MEEDLKTRLRADAGLIALLGTHSRNNRPMIDWGTRPDDKALPALVMFKVSPGVEYDQDGATELEGPRVQFSVYAESYGETALVFRRLRELIENPATVGSTYFDRAFLDAERDLDPKDIAGGERIFHRSADYIIWNRRSDP